MSVHARPVHLSKSKLKQLKALRQDCHSDQVYNRVRLVLALNEGLSNSKAARRAGVHINTAIYYRKLFHENPEADILDLSKSGRPKSVVNDTMITVLLKLIKKPPVGAAKRWTLKLLAARMRVSVSSVRRMLISTNIDLKQQSKT